MSKQFAVDELTGRGRTAVEGDEGKIFTDI